MTRNPSILHDQRRAGPCRPELVREITSHAPGSTRAGSLRRRSRQRGSLIIYVVVALSLLALLGAAYLQIARMDRIATAQLSSSNIDRVAAAIITYIGDVLRDDLLDSNGNFFNQEDLADTTDADEYNDMPWTNDAVNYAVADFDGAALGNAVGGSFDDTWLASTWVDFDTSATVPRWPHISNLMGIWLRMPKSTGSQSFPEERVIDNSGRFNTDSTVSGSIHNKITGDSQSMDANDTADWESTGVDADGDGIPDSRWTWAPIRSIGGVAYVMAVRIIDNSSLINVNTATGLTSDGTTLGGGGDYPRGYFPTDIDMTRLLQREANAGGAPGSAVWDDELLAFFGSPSRGVDIGATITPHGLNTTWTSGPYGTSDATTTSRVGNWLVFGKLAAWSQYTVPAREELELRYGHGLNFSDFTTAILETYMPTLLRAGPPYATDWTTVVGGSTAADMQNYLNGGSGAISGRTFPEIRHFLTGRSNTAIYMPNPANIYAAATAVTHQYDLVYLHYDGSGNYDEDTDGDGFADRVTDLILLNNGVLQLGTPGTDTYLAESASEIDDIAVDFALAIQDYSDVDHTPSFYTYDKDGSSTIDPGETYYGMEILPFIREVYLQIAYDDQDLADINGWTPADGTPPYDDSNLDVDTFKDTWVRADGTNATNDSRCMVIELGNPFDKAIIGSGSEKMLEDRVQIAVVDLDTDTDISVYTFDNSAPDIPSRGNIVVYSNTSNPYPEGTTGDLMVDLEVPNPVADHVDAGPDVLTFPIDSDRIDGSKFSIELRVTPDGGTTWVAYDRLAMSDVNMDLPEFVSHRNFEDTPHYRHAQVSVARDGQTVRYVSNNGRATVGQRPRPADSLWPPSSTNPAPADDYHNQSNSPIDALRQDAKGSIDAGTALDNFQIPIANRTIMSLGELGIIQMFGFTDGDTGDFPQRLDALNANRRNLDISATAAVPLVTGIPHAAMLLDQFTTLSPRNDGVDNDNADGDDDPDTGADDEDYEQVVAGRININTASLEVATLAAPLPEAVDDIQALMESVKTYRDDPTSRTGGNYPTGMNTTRKGIAHLGELMFVNPNAGPSSGNMKWVAESGTGSQKDTVYDHYPLYEVQDAGDAVRYDVIDGAEEAMARYQFLSQAFTTRSDTFTAYVIVLGYPAGDFRSGAVESKSFYLVYDRSNITSKDDRVQFIGPFER